MAKLPEDRLPTPPDRTAFRLDKNGNYHCVVTKADLHLDATDVTIVRLIHEKLNFSDNPENKSKNNG